MLFETRRGVKESLVGVLSCNTCEEAGSHASCGPGYHLTLEYMGSSGQDSLQVALGCAIKLRQ